MYEKLLLVIFGAGLGKLIELYFNSRRLNRLHAALIEELEDIKDMLLLVCIAYERNIQIYALNGISPNLPFKLSNPIFRKHYSDVALKLEASQRKSFAMIDAYIDAVNRGIDEMEESYSYTVENLSDVAIEKWGDLLKVQYCNAASAYWHVNYHIANKDLPFLGGEGTEEHKAYLSQRKSSKEHIQKLIEGARSNLKRENFDEI